MVRSGYCSGLRELAGLKHVRLRASWIGSAAPRFGCHHAFSPRLDRLCESSVPDHFRSSALCEYPLRGCIILFMGSTVLIIRTAVGMTAGLTVSLLYLGLFQDRSRGRPRCPKCWYNMTGAPSLVCPECGYDARRSKALYCTRRRRWAMVAAVLMAACCYYAWLVRIRVIWLHEPVYLAVRPTSYFLATLPHAQRAQTEYIIKRVQRFGVWPWESVGYHRVRLGTVRADRQSRWHGFSAG